MHRGVVALLALAGCDRVFLAERAPPDAVVIDMELPPDSPPSACRFEGDPDGDNDRDGVANHSDACPDTFETEQDRHNEDADCANDACDPCPHLASDVAEVDLDGDQIGDACDRDQAVANTARFEGFDNFDELILVGSWAPASNVDKLANTTNSLAIAFLNDPPTSRLFRIDTVLEFLDAPTSAWDAGIVFGMTGTTATSNGYFVGIHKLANNPARLGLYTIANQTIAPLVTDQSVMFDHGQSVRLTIDVAQSAIRVQTVVNDTVIAAHNFAIPIALGSATYYGPATKGPVRAAFRYLWHVQ